jgi:hypothetical protein
MTEAFLKNAMGCTAGQTAHVMVVGAIIGGKRSDKKVISHEA